LRKYGAGGLLAILFTGVVVVLPGAGAASAAERARATRAEELASTVLPVPTAPTVVTGAAARLSATSAALYATVNSGGAETAYRFEYGTGAGNEHSSASMEVAAGTGVVTVSTTIANLSPGTYYRYRAVARNGVGEATGEYRSFRTPDAILAGRYAVTLTVRHGGSPLGQHPGETAHRLYRFRASCQRGECPTVLLHRAAAAGSFAVKLRRHGADHYVGTERVRGRCTDGEHFRSRDTVSIYPTATAGSRATQISGTLIVRLRGCVRGTEVSELGGRLAR
jgi:hypothetical protein